MALLSNIWKYVPTKEDLDYAARINGECIDLTRMLSTYKEEEWPEEFKPGEEYQEQHDTKIGDQSIQDLIDSLIGEANNKQGGTNDDINDVDDNGEDGDEDGEGGKGGGESDGEEEGGQSDEQGQGKENKPMSKPTQVIIPNKSQREKESQAMQNYKERTQLRFVDPTYWSKGSTRVMSDGEVKNTEKWIEFKYIYDYIRSKINQLQILEVNEWQKGFMSGDRVNVRKYALMQNGSDDIRIFDRETVESEDETKLNIIIALDMSGSMNGLRMHQASSAVLCLVKALENQRIRHSLMFYADQIALVSVDCDGKSNYNNLLAGGLSASGGTEVQKTFVIAEEIIKKNSDRKNIMFVISDGEVGDVSADIKHLKEQTNNVPTDVYLMGYGLDFNPENNYRVFGKQFVKKATRPEEFAKQFLDVIAEAIKKNKKGGHRA